MGSFRRRITKKTMNSGIKVYYLHMTGQNSVVKDLMDNKRIIPSTPKIERLYKMRRGIREFYQLKNTI